MVGGCVEGLWVRSHEQGLGFSFLGFLVGWLVGWLVGRLLVGWLVVSLFG